VPDRPSAVQRGQRERLLYQHLAEPVPLDPVPEPLRPLIEAGMAKDPGSRPADGAALVAELRAVAGGAYGPGWEQRGHSQLAAAALLLAALWPSGALPAVQGTAVHRIRLRRHLRPRHLTAVKASAAAAVAIAVVAVVVVAAAQPRSREAPKEPSKEPTVAAEPTAAATISGSLEVVAAASGRSAWALGCTGTPCVVPFMVRWNGTTWTHVPILGLNPEMGYLLLDVAAAPDGSAWAVGYTSNGSDNGTGLSTVILRWNGTAWMRVPSPSPGPTSHLSSVTVISADSAWAIGVTTNSSGNEIPLILRWNGTTWTRQPTPGSVEGSLYGIDAISASDVWAFGQSPSATRISVLIMRWNGVTWTQVPSPSPGTGDGISGMAAASADSAWAVGFTQSSSGVRGTLTLRWNGTAWSMVPNPSPAGTTLSSVAAMPDGSAWAVGYTGNDADGRMLMLRWNGAAWTRVPIPDPAGSVLAGVTALSSSDAWAVGSADGKALILQWNGQKWSVVAGQLSPTGAATSSPAPSAVTSPSPGTAPTAVPSPGLPPQQQAAQDLARLLAQSGADRAAITQAFGAVADCSPGLSQDETIFSNAASSRQDLLGKLAALPDRSALPAPMLQDLTMAWQASGQADQDFARWAQDEISHGCSTNYQSDASYQAATAPDEQATKDKKAFAALWTAIADEYGLPLYQYNQI